MIITTTFEYNSSLPEPEFESVTQMTEHFEYNLQVVFDIAKKHAKDNELKVVSHEIRQYVSSEEFEVDITFEAIKEEVVDEKES